MKAIVQPATLADVPILATNSLAAFANDPIVSLLRRDIKPEALYTHTCTRFERGLRNHAVNGIRIDKVIDEETGAVLGSARWSYRQNLTPDQLAEKQRLESEPPTHPEGYNHALHKAFYAGLDRAREKWVDESKDFTLLGLAISPTHQRQGLGSLLIKAGLDVADKVGARCYVEASKVGVGLYEKFGWERVDEVVVDLGVVGGEGVAREVCLLRGVGGRG